MCTFVVLKEGENELRTIVTVICAKGLRKHWRLADQNTRRSENCDEITSSHEYLWEEWWRAKRLHWKSGIVRFGQQQTFRNASVMSALPPKADMAPTAVSVAI